MNTNENTPPSVGQTGVTSLFSQIVAVRDFIDVQPRSVDGNNAKDRAICMSMKATGLSWEDTVTLIRISRQNYEIKF